MATSKRKNSPQEDVARDRILLAARDLFTKQGFAKTSTRAIAGAARCNISLIPYYFGSKEGLLEAVGLSVAARAGEELDFLKRSKLAPRDQLEHFVDFALAHMRQNRKFLALLFKSFLAEGRPIPKKISKQIERNVERLVAIFREMQSEKLIDSSLNPELSAASLMGMVVFHNLAEPLVSALYDGPKKSLAEASDTTIKEIFLHGILTGALRGGNKR